MRPSEQECHDYVASLVRDLLKPFYAKGSIDKVSFLNTAKQSLPEAEFFKWPGGGGAMRFMSSTTPRIEAIHKKLALVTRGGFHKPIYALRQALTPKKTSQMFSVERKMPLGPTFSLHRPPGVDPEK